MTHTHMTHILATILTTGPAATPTAGPSPTAIATATATSSSGSTLSNLVNYLGIFIAFLVTFMVIFWLTLIIWTFRDIRSRTQDLLSQILATVLVTVFFIGGLFIYLLLRPRNTLAEIYERQLEEESLLAEMTERQTCNNCHARVESDFQVCPSCGQKLAKYASNAWDACHAGNADARDVSRESRCPYERPTILGREDVRFTGELQPPMNLTSSFFKAN